MVLPSEALSASISRDASGVEHTFSHLDEKHFVLGSHSRTAIADGQQKAIS